MSLAPLHRRWSTYLYLQDLLAGASVLEVGAGDGAAIARAGARGVATCEAEALEVMEAQPAGGFDVILALDVEPATLPKLVAQAERLLTPTGVLVVGGVNRDRPQANGGFSYYELADALEGKFAEVKMVGQAPFYAASLVEYGVAEPEPVLDGRLVERGEKVERYLAVAAKKALSRSRGYAVVQLPLAELQAAAPAPSGELEGKLASLEAECQKLRDKEKDARAEAWKALKARSEAEAAAAEVREDTVRKLKDARKLASVELTRAMEEATKKNVSLKEELVRTERERKEMKTELATAKEEIARLQAPPPPAPVEVAPPPAPVVEAPPAEDLLKPRVAELEAELARRDAAVERATAAAGHERARAERLVAEERRALGERNEARARTAEAEARASAVGLQLEQAHAQLASVEERAQKAESELAAKKDRVKQLKRELEESERRVLEAQERAAHLELVRQRLGAVESALRGETERMAHLEEALRRAATPPAPLPTGE